MPRAIAMTKSYVGFCVRQPGEVFEVPDDFPFGAAVQPAPDDPAELHRMAREATKTLEFPQDRIMPQVKQRNTGVLPWLEAQARIPATIGVDDLPVADAGSTPEFEEDEEVIHG